MEAQDEQLERCFDGSTKRKPLDPSRISLENVLGRGISQMQLEQIGADRTIKIVAADLQGRRYLPKYIGRKGIAFQHPEGYIINIILEANGYVATSKGLPDEQVATFREFFSSKGIKYAPLK